MMRVVMWRKTEADMIEPLDGDGKPYHEARTVYGRLLPLARLWDERCADEARVARIERSSRRAASGSSEQRICAPRSSNGSIMAYGWRDACTPRPYPFFGDQP
jgi:hypothetical protein